MRRNLLLIGIATLALACAVVAQAVGRMPADRSCSCGSALAHAIITDRKLVPEATRRKLGIIVDKYFV